MLQFTENHCIKYASSNLVSMGSEYRSVNDDGWVDTQLTGGRHAIAFSLLPIEVEFTGEERVILAPPIAAMTRPNGGYTRVPMNSRGQRTIFFSIDSQTARETVSLFDASVDERDDPFPARSAPCSETAIATAIQLERAVFQSDHPLDTLQFDELSIQIISHSLNTYYQLRSTPRLLKKAKTDQLQRDRVHHVMASICNMPEHSWTLGELAENVSLSPAYLSRVFKACTGKTLSQSLRLIRTVRALEKLGDYRGNLTRLAFECGFASHSHMTSTLAGTIGFAPSELLTSPVSTTQQLIGKLINKLKSWPS